MARVTGFMLPGCPARLPPESSSSAGAGSRSRRLPADAASAKRVDALVTYVRQNTAGFAVQRGRIVFSSGWAGAAEGFGRPPPQYREGGLMLAQAMAADIGGSSLTDYADTHHRRPVP